MRKCIWLICVELCIYVSFLTIDILGGEYCVSSIQISNGLKFTGIVFCFLFLLMHMLRYKSEDGVISTLAMFSTMLADVTLLFTQKFELGVLFFIIVQQLYWRRISGEFFKSNDSYKQSMLFFIIGMIGLLLTKQWIVLLVSIYFLSLLRNTFSCYKKEGYSLQTIAFLLFVACDINVGVMNIIQSINVSGFEKIRYVTSIAIWLFYLPSQVLLTMVGTKNHM